MPDLDAQSAPHPVGTIIMWSGLLSAIPQNWSLCDGTGGTPDLIAFFAIGAPPATEPGTEIGADFHSLSQSQLPIHTHTFTGGHRHEMELSSVAVAGGSTGLQGNNNAGTYLFKNETAGGSFASAGSSSSHENKPPYFELAFIQRVS